MIERLRFPWGDDLPDAEVTKHKDYQAAAMQLYYNCLASTSEELSVYPPGEGEGSRVKGFDAPDPDNDEEPTWEEVEITVHPEGHLDDNGRDFLAEVVLNQFVDEEYIELLKTYRILFDRSRYRVEMSNSFYFGNETQEPWYDLDNAAIVNLDEVRGLDETISGVSGG